MSRIAIWSTEAPSLGPAVAALGVFDGVHIGHQALVRDAVRIARMHDVLAVVVTFDRDPDQVVSPAVAAPQLTDLDDKLAFLAAEGPDVVLVVPFDPRMASTAPLAFLDEVLLRAMAPVDAVVGYDFRFGHRAEGDVDTLVRYGAAHGFTVVAHDLVQRDGEPVTSTRIRALVARGDVAGAAALLGRPHRLRGEVVPGRGAGSSLGTPTANVAVGVYAAVPADGVYAGRVTVGEETYLAGVSIGAPPTFGGAEDTIEAHLLDFSGDLYGESVLIEFGSRLRDQRRFSSEVDLTLAISADLERVREVLEG